MRAIIFVLLVSVLYAPCQAQTIREDAATKAPFNVVVPPSGGSRLGLRDFTQKVRDLPPRGQLVLHHQYLELALRAYGETTQPGNYVFGTDLQRQFFEPSQDLRSTLFASTAKPIREQVDQQPIYHWQLLDYYLQELRSPTGRDKRADKETSAPFSGFSAATYVNHRSKHVVLAIAGTKLSSLADLKNDLAALLRMKPPQFDEALDYFRSVLDRYESKFPGYTFACTGHSLGGGACAYAAAVLSRPGVTLNPIGSKWIPGIPEPSKATIVNYIDPNDLAYKTFSLVRLPPVGQLYWIKDPPRNAGWLATAKKFFGSFGQKTA